MNFFEKWLPGLARNVEKFVKNKENKTGFELKFAIKHSANGFSPNKYLSMDLVSAITS